MGMTGIVANAVDAVTDIAAVSVAVAASAVVRAAAAVVVDAAQRVG
jgi:hypothetical protein